MASGLDQWRGEFVARANAELKELRRELGAANWVRSTYITQDTAIIAATASETYSAWHSKMVAQALAYEGQDLDPSTRRAIELLKLGTSAPAPNDAAKHAGRSMPARSTSTTTMPGSA